MNGAVHGIAGIYTDKVLREAIEPKIDPTGIIDFLNNPSVANALPLIASAVFLPAGKIIKTLTPTIKQLGIGALRKLATPENMEQILLLAKSGKLGPYIQNLLKSIDEAGLELKITPEKIELAKKTIQDTSKKIDDTAKTVTTPVNLKAEAETLSKAVVPGATTPVSTVPGSIKTLSPAEYKALSPEQKAAIDATLYAKGAVVPSTTVGMTPLKPIVTKPAPLVTGAEAGKAIPIPPVLKPVVSEATKNMAKILTRASIIKVVTGSLGSIAIFLLIPVAAWLSLRKKKGEEISKQEQNLRKGVIYVGAPDGTIKPLYAILASGQLQPQQLQDIFNRSRIPVQVGEPGWQVKLNAAWNIPESGTEKPYTAQTRYGEYRTFIGKKIPYVEPGKGGEYSYTVIYLQNTASEQQWFPFDQSTQEVTITRPDGSYIFTDLSQALKNLNIIGLYERPRQKQEQEESEKIPSPINDPAEFRAYIQTSFYDDIEPVGSTVDSGDRSNQQITQAKAVTPLKPKNIAGEIDRPMGGFNTPVDYAPSRPDTFINPPFSFEDLFTNPQERIQKLLNPQAQSTANIPSYSGAQQQSLYQPNNNYKKTTSGLNPFINIFVDDEDKDTF